MYQKKKTQTFEIEREKNNDVASCTIIFFLQRNKNAIKLFMNIVNS